MSVETALARISEINSAFTPPTATQTATAADGRFAQVLNQAGMAQAAAPFAPGIGGGAAVAAAQGEVGQAEQPPGSNDSPRIAEYRSAVPGGGVGPWCAYFVSWCAKQQGTPLGDNGEGFASVDAAWAWAERAGRAKPAAAGPPRPGDLIVWDEHIGIVESVGTDGSINTIEGNSSDKVSRRTYAAGEGIGYISMG